VSASKPRSYSVCSHPDRAVVERALGIGQSPRSIQRRYSDLTRRAIQKHRDECPTRTEESGAA
jgi:hypothetical protein